MAEQDAISDDDWPTLSPHSAEETEMLMREKADLWAMSYGFRDTEEMKEWGEQVERERLAEKALSSKRAL